MTLQLLNDCRFLGGLIMSSKTWKPVCCGVTLQIPSAGLKNYVIPPEFDDVEFPANRNKLRFVDRQPTYPAGIRPPKMQKGLINMRGPELIHNKLIHKQFGIIAQGPGRMKYSNFENIRLALNRKMDAKRMFAVWRVDAPWQSITKKGQGKRMGGGKGSIDHYVSPIKYGRVIVEMGGYCEFEEVRPMLSLVAHRLPFKTRVVSQKMLEEMKEEEERLERDNINPYTFKYIVQNDFGGCNRWISPYDRKWFGKHR